LLFASVGSEYPDSDNPNVMKGSPVSN
jgi:hypothetical protein